MSESRAVEAGTMTIEEFWRLPEEELWRQELVRGSVVREPLAGGEHGRVAASVAVSMVTFVRARGLGVVLAGDPGFILSNAPPTVRGPDVAFVARSRIPSGGVPEQFFPGPPDLAVEIVSPSNTAAEIQEKVLDYLAAGTREVWVVYPRTRTVAVHRTPREALLLGEGEALDGGEVLPGFRCPVEEVFAE